MEPHKELPWLQICCPAGDQGHNFKVLLLFSLECGARDEWQPLIRGNLLVRYSKAAGDLSEVPRCAGLSHKDFA